MYCAPYVLQFELILLFLKNMHHLILDNYRIITYSLYIILFAINIFAIIKYLAGKNFWIQGTIGKSESISKFDYIYIVYILLFITLERFFSFFLGRTDIDENFHIAIAMKFVKGDNFWIDIDPSSVGPLNTILFSFVSLFTGGVSFITAKVSVVLVACVSFIFLYLSFIKIVGKAIAILLTTCFVICVCDIGVETSLSYNSEMISYLLFSFWFYCYLKATVDNGRLLWFCSAFFTIGLMPFGKLQFSPIALVLFLITFYDLLKSETCRNNYKHRLITKLIPCTCSLVPLLIVLLDALIHNSLIWFYRFYIQNMISYMNIDHLNMAQTKYQIMFDNLTSLIASRFVLYTLTIVNVILIIINVLKKNYSLVLKCFLIIGVSYYSMVRSLMPYNHYTNIVIIPLFMCSAILIYSLKSNKLCFFIASCTCLFFCYYYFSSFEIDFNKKNSSLYSVGVSGEWISIAEDLKQMSTGSDRLVVWGWEDDLYILSGLPGGTAEIAIGGFIPNYIQRKYPSYTREKFIEDLIHNKPRFIIDTPSPLTELYDSYIFSVENYPDIYEVIQKNYHFKKFYTLKGNKEECNEFSKQVHNTDTNSKCIQIKLYEIN